MLTSQEDGTREWDDEALLQRAAELNRVLITQDEDFVVIAIKWQTEGKFLGGVIFAHQQRLSIGELVHDLALLAECVDPSELQNQLTFLPLP